ncbi:(deoxy)nucleoside triphosphate pyrophosphohydrolase [Jatrophihabitans sp. DSM 45814]
MALAALQRVLDRIRATETTVVVAAAIFSYGRVLAAQRNHPAELAGKWEFPGGKVEKGESHARALIRECAEELDIEVVIDGELARKHLDDGALLVLLEAHLIDPQAQPTALEHRELRWLAAAQLEDVEWLSANWTFLEYVSRALQMQARRP